MTKNEVFAQVKEALSSDDGIDEALFLLKKRVAITDTIPDVNDHTSTFPEDALKDLDYLRRLKKAFKGRKMDPFILMAIRTIFRKWGYHALSKVIASIGRKLNFPFRTTDIEAILDKYNMIIEPILVLVLEDLINAFRKKRTQEQKEEQRIEPRKNTNSNNIKDLLKNGK